MKIWIERCRDEFYVHVREPDWNAKEGMFDAKPPLQSLEKIGDVKTLPKLAKAIGPRELAEFDLELKNATIWEPRE